MEALKVLMQLEMWVLHFPPTCITLRHNRTIMEAHTITLRHNHTIMEAHTITFMRNHTMTLRHNRTIMEALKVLMQLETWVLLFLPTWITLRHNRSIMEDMGIHQVPLQLETWVLRIRSACITLRHKCLDPLEEHPLVFNAGNGYGQYMPNGPYYPSAMPAYVGGNVQGVSYPSTENNNTIRERGNASFGRSNGTHGFLRRQSRRPWTNRSNNRAIQQHSVAESGGANCSLGVDRKLYNSPEFVTEYDDGKIFIIKSYSEANVHKSIKYGVWSSTSAGNKKLNSAYIEAQKKGHSSPIFLFFSVNASGRFCGVAEMIGPVDFEKSVDYWNKDKWTGQFPVKWHIVKDVPSFRFRHIILENNDNKPVTNSRDTQEVKLEQGLEMLSIFKTHEYKESILDAFEFYDKREAALRRRKARQQETRTTTRNRISKRFVQVVKFKGETSNVGISTDKTSSSNGVGSSPTPKDV
uniref:YTH domain-containing family protein n=1 Tax=Musa acuminata subsp. malaccensis TaxID=214687 RepID=A0A804HP17_MUSAM